MTHRRQVEAILAGARAERAALLAQLSPALRASLPVDATGISQALDHLGEAAGLDLHAQQLRAAKTNAAVLHGRVFGRTPLSRETVDAAFRDGARARAQTLSLLRAGALAAGGRRRGAGRDAARGRRRSRGDLRRPGAGRAAHRGAPRRVGAL